MQNNEKNNLKITAFKNGPLMVEGTCKVEKQSGELIKEGEKLFLCRCCDGTHKKVNFEAD